MILAAAFSSNIVSQSVSALHLAEMVGGSPSFPQCHQLIVTTSTGAFSWDRHGIIDLFRSDSGGVVAAKKAGNILAIADGRVVILHDIDKGSQKRSYRLKAPDVGRPDLCSAAMWTLMAL